MAKSVNIEIQKYPIGTKREVIWESENENIVSVVKTSTGCTLTAQGVGETYIICKPDNESFIKRYPVHVYQSETDIQIDEPIIDPNNTGGDDDSTSHNDPIEEFIVSYNVPTASYSSRVIPATGGTVQGISEVRQTVVYNTGRTSTLKYNVTDPVIKNRSFYIIRLGATSEQIQNDVYEHITTDIDSGKLTCDLSTFTLNINGHLSNDAFTVIFEMTVNGRSNKIQGPTIRQQSALYQEIEDVSLTLNTVNGTPITADETINMNIGESIYVCAVGYPENASDRESLSIVNGSLAKDYPGSISIQGYYESIDIDYLPNAEGSTYYKIDSDGYKYDSSHQSRIYDNEPNQYDNYPLIGIIRKITALKTGNPIKLNINRTAAFSLGGTVKSFYINVLPKYVESITLSSNELTLDAGETVELHITNYTPEDASTRMLLDFEYSVDNSDIVKISRLYRTEKQGKQNIVVEDYLKIKGLSGGICNITITGKYDGDASVTIPINVNAVEEPIIPDEPATPDIPSGPTVKSYGEPSLTSHWENGGQKANPLYTGIDYDESYDNCERSTYKLVVDKITQTEFYTDRTWKNVEYSGDQLNDMNIECSVIAGGHIIHSYDSSSNAFVFNYNKKGGYAKLLISYTFKGKSYSSIATLYQKSINGYIWFGTLHTNNNFATEYPSNSNLINELLKQTHLMKKKDNTSSERRFIFDGIEDHDDNLGWMLSYRCYPGSTGDNYNTIVFIRPSSWNALDINEFIEEEVNVINTSKNIEEKIYISKDLCQTHTINDRFGNAFTITYFQLPQNCIFKPVDSYNAGESTNKLRIYLLRNYENVELDPHPFISLGDAGVWSPYNFGAESKYDMGIPFAWGETETKDEFTEANYKFYKDGNKKQQIKYCVKPEYWAGDTEYPDGRTSLDFEDDPVRKAWGPNWRMPTANEMYLLSLSSAGTYSYNDDRKVNGELVKGAVHKWGALVMDPSIYIPAVQEDDEGVIYWTRDNYGYDEYDRNNYQAKSYVYRKGDLTRTYGDFKTAVRYAKGYIRPIYVGPYMNNFSMESEVTIHVGETYQLKPKTTGYHPEFSGSWDFAILMSNKCISITDDGLVTGLKVGDDHVICHPIPKKGYQIAIRKACVITVVE